MNFSLSPYAPGQEMPLYNFGYQDPEEERKRKEREAIAARMEAEALANPVAPIAPEPTQIKETRTIDPQTGEVKLKIEGTEKDLSSANPLTPTLSTAKAPVAPFNQQQYNASIGAQESGNRPNIGFHDRSKSTAFGQYGLTNAAYQDARRLNPNLPQDISQATPEQQTQAMNAFTQQNAKALQSFGVEPTQNNLSAAHFLGAKGLSDYMKTGYISPQAAAANGGEENVRRIVNQRLGGQAAAASGATQMPTAMPGPGVAVATGQGVQGTMTTPPQGAISPAQLSQQQQLPANQGIKIPGLTPIGQMGQQAQTETTQTPAQMGIQRFQDNQDNLDELMKMRNDTNVPEYLRKRSGERAYELMNQQYKTEQATAKVNEMIQNGDQLGFAKVLASKPKDEEGSWLKMLALGFISPELAGQEAIKLGLAPAKWTQTSFTDKDGNQVGVEVKTRSDGKILGGTKFDGTPLTTEELNLVSTASPLGKGTSLSAEVYVDPTTGQRYRSGFDASGKAAMVNIQGGAPYRGDPKNLTIQSIGTAAQKAENAAQVKLRYAGPTSYTEAGAAAAGKFNFENGTNIGYASQQPGAPLVDLNTGKPVQVGAGGVITTTQTGTPNAPTMTGAQPAGGLTPGDITRQGKMKEAEGQQFVKYAADDITPKADAGAQISRIRKEQLYGPDGILNNAEIAGILQGQGSSSSEVANIFRDIIAGNFKEQADLSQRINSLGLNQRQKDVVSRQVGLMLSVNPLTLRANAGPGAVSDAEQKANREANVDILRQPLYSGLSLLTRDQFNKDMNVARAEFKVSRPDLQTTEQFNSAWSSEKAKKEKEFDQIYAERAKYIAKYNSDGKNPGAIIDAYKHYPVPVFDAQSKTWDYGTEFSKKAARPKLKEFNK